MIKILLVEDELLEREAFKGMVKELEEEAIVVGEATNGKEAVDMAFDLCPDIVFLDVRIPSMDGFEVHKKMKEKLSNTMICLMDYYNSPYSKKDFEKVDSYLVKPVRPSILQTKITEYKNRKWLGKMSGGGVLEELLHRIHLDQFREARKALKSLVQELHSDYYGFQNYRDYVLVIADSMVRLYEAKGFKAPLRESHKWMQQKEQITLYNFEELLDSLLQDIFKDIISKNVNSTTQNEIQTILNYIEMNYNEGISLEDVAEVVHLTPHYVSKLFKKEVETTFVNYVMDRKMEHAMDLLKYTDMPIINIAMDLSYQEHNYFSKVFKKKVGITPSEYRKQHRELKDQELQKKKSYVINGKWYI